MTVTQSTKKQLFGASGNQCAHPDCDQELVDIEAEFVIGVIAHIHAESPGGPRYDPDMSEEERSSVSNLMVLCPTHHTMIDQNPGEYPAELLKDWKQEHEQKATPPADLPNHVLEQLETEGPDPHEVLREWEADVLERWETLVKDEYDAIEDSPYEHGHYTFSYKILGEFEQPGLAEFRDKLLYAKGSITGWPAWLGADKYAKPIDGELEAWLIESPHDYPSHKDFWRASPDGQLFLLRGYHEDAPQFEQEGEVFNVFNPVAVLADCFLHANRLGNELMDESATIVYKTKWTGLSERRLIDEWEIIWPPESYVAYQDSVNIHGTTTIEEIDNALPELIKGVTHPLYESFDLFELELEAIDRALSELSA